MIILILFTFDLCRDPEGQKKKKNLPQQDSEIQETYYYYQ